MEVIGSFDQTCFFGTRWMKMFEMGSLEWEGKNEESACRGVWL